MSAKRHDGVLDLGFGKKITDFEKIDGAGLKTDQIASSITATYTLEIGMQKCRKAPFWI